MTKKDYGALPLRHANKRFTVSKEDYGAHPLSNSSEMYVDYSFKRYAEPTHFNNQTLEPTIQYYNTIQ